jgi:hypothetical protein
LVESEKILGQSLKTLDIARQDVVLDTLVQQGECEHTLICLLTNMSV